MPNTIRYDPSRTTTLRGQYSREMRRRFYAIRALIRKAIVDLDVLGLNTKMPMAFNKRGGPSNEGMVHQAGANPALPAILTNELPEAQAFRFQTDHQKVRSFNTWLQKEVDAGILEVDGAGKPWTSKYIDSAYRKGQVHAYAAAHPEELAESIDFYAGGRKQFLQSAFAQPEQTAKLKLLYTRSYEDLKGISAAMSQKVSRVLADGIGNGLNPRVIAKTLSDEVAGITKKRALVMARTEVIHAHAEGQLDSFEQMGIEELTVHAEWSTAKDDRVCSMCAPLEGLVLTVDEARGMLPRHPSCRCAWIPANVGEPTKDSTWSKGAGQYKIRKSIQAEHPKLPIKAARAASVWIGKTKKIASKLKPGTPTFKKVQAAKKAAVLEAIAKKKEAAHAARMQADAVAGVKKLKTSAPGEVLDHANYSPVKGWGPPPPHKTQSYGTLVFDDQGRVLMREPAEHFGGAHWTFPKGGGTKPGTTALAELAEETGHKGIIHDILPGDFVGTETKTNYFIGRSAGFDAGLMDTETAATKWMTYAEAKQAIALSSDAVVVARDTKVLESAFRHLAESDGALFAQVVKSGTTNLQAAKVAAAKAAKAHKIKASLAKTNYKKPKFGGGVTVDDYVNPATQQKLSLSGVNKVLSEKGWHSSTLPRGVADRILEADDIVAQKVIMSGLKKAPKTAPKVPLPGAPAPVDPLPVPKTVSLPLERDLTKVKDLPGSTRPYLAKDPAGKQWVVKDTSGTKIKPDHLRSEATADDLYRRLGVPVPEGGIVNAPDGPMKITEFLEGGETLAEWKVGKSATQVGEMHKQLQKNFVADALFANYDVAGLANDNIFIVGGKAYRIDNGGALAYRAQGKLKRTWGNTVRELETLRDASVNANTAAIFDGITDAEIHDQIRRVVAKRDALLATVDDRAVRATLAARIDDLSSRLPSISASRPVPPGVRRGVYANGPEVPAKVVRAKSNGINLAGDRRDIEDNNILIWEEIGPRNKARTRLQFKVTAEGSEKIKQALGPELQRARATATVGSNVHPDDLYWNGVLNSAKTVNHHAVDKAYNQATLKQLTNIKDDIAKKVATATGDTKEMLQHYADAIAQIESAKAAGKTTGKLAQYVHKPKPVTVVEEAKRAFTVRQEAAIDFDVMDFTDGVGKKTRGVNRFRTGEAYIIDAGEGIEIKFVPSVVSVTSQDGLALKGVTSVTIPGKVSEAAINKALNVVRSIGIDVAAPSAAYEEALYLHRNLYIMGHADDAAYKKIWLNEAITDEERVIQMKRWVKDTTGIDVAKVSSYNPGGITKHADGSGYRHWERWDITPDEIADKMGDYSLVHTTGSLGDSTRGSVGTALDGFLKSGGEFTATTGRIRKGVSVSGTGGASSASDMTSGGASYFFTRLKKADSRTNGFYFKIGRLSRQDAVSYGSDKFGRISDIRSRGKTIEDYKRFGGYSGNETIFKEGLSIDDLDFIRVHDEAERSQVLSVFKNNGVETLADGRSVEDIVMVGSKAPKQRVLK